MGSRATKKIPEFIYFVGTGSNNGWIDGPYVHPQKYRENRKFKLVEEQEYKNLLEDALKYRSLQK